MNLRNITRMVLVLVLATGVSTTAWAQYTGGGTGGSMPGTTYNNGGYGHGAAIGIGAAAAAAVVGIALYVHHKHSVKEARASVSGCTQISNQRVSLMDDKNKRVYSLANAGEYLKTGERVELAGYTSTDRSGAHVFTIQSLTKDWGSCVSEASLQLQPTAGYAHGGQR